MIKGLDDFRTYNLAMEVGETVWAVVLKWGFFEKDTVGKQFVKATDSIAANLSEGLGRSHYRETKNFGYYSRGSLFETKTWLTIARNRGLANEETFDDVNSKLDALGRMTNTYINSLGETNASESPMEYSNNEFLSSNNTVDSCPTPNTQYPKR